VVAAIDAAALSSQRRVTRALVQQVMAAQVFAEQALAEPLADETARELVLGPRSRAPQPKTSQA